MAALRYAIKLTGSVGHLILLCSCYKNLSKRGSKVTYFHLYMFTIKGQLYAIDKPLIMGILNLTPDSFYDGGKYDHADAALLQSKKMEAEGADIIDLGAASTRPGAALINPEEEWQRLEAPLRQIRQAFPHLLLSIDTYHSSTAKRAVKAGADIINDVSGGTFDEQMITTVAQLKVPYILMHLTDVPEKMQKNTLQGDAFQEVSRFFSVQLQRCAEVGLQDVILDVGLGFGKSLAQNYQLLAALPDFCRVFEQPILIGASRKSMINKLLNIKAADALNGTTAVHTLALMQGAKIVRVHDVKEAVQARTIVNYYQNVAACRS